LSLVKDRTGAIFDTIEKKPGGASVLKGLSEGKESLQKGGSVGQRTTRKFTERSQTRGVGV